MEFETQKLLHHASPRRSAARDVSMPLLDNGDLARAGNECGGLRRFLSSEERRLWVFLAFWFVAGVLQAIFTNLDGEEAYYAMFAKNLAWGYFDHPPALAFFVRLGMQIFPGDLGPRFMMVVLSTATVWLGSRLLPRKQITLYIAVVAGLVLTQAGSFLVKTDVPLVFFATLFFYLFRIYLNSSNRVVIALLPLAIAGMLLSKYHGILIVGLTILANPKLLLRPSFYVITLLSCVLMFPHAAWLYAHDFVTIRYHLGGRTDAGFRWQNILGYVFMQPFVFGPAVGLILLPAALVARTRNRFERTLKFDLVCILVFFFVASFFVRIHMHWTSVALIPLLALSVPYIYDREKLRKLTMFLAVGSAICFIPVRIYLAWDYLPAFVDQKMEVIHGWPQWAQDIHRLADGRSVVFLDDYISAGRYSYYTGEMAHSCNSMWYQSTQQDIWPIEENFRGKRVMLVNGLPLNHFITTRARNRQEIRYRFVDDFQAYSKVEIRMTQSGPVHCAPGTPVEVPITLLSHYASPIVFKADTELAPVIMYCIFKGRDPVAAGTCDVIAGSTLGHELNRTVELRPPAVAGNYTLRLAIQAGWLQPANNWETRGVAMDVAARSLPDPNNKQMR